MSSLESLESLEAHLATVVAAYDYRLLELEFRIGLKPKAFLSSVGRARFEQLRQRLGQHATHSTSVHHIFDSGVRHEITGGSEKKWVRKARLATFDVAVDSGWYVRGSTALESECAPESRKHPDHVRHRERWTYVSGPWAIDLTIASGGSDPDAEESYEVEVELIDRDELFRVPLPELIARGMRITTDLIALFI